MGNPQYESIVVGLYYSREDFLSLFELGSYEEADVFRVDFCLLLEWTKLSKEVTWHDVEVIVDYQNGAELLERPNLAVDLAILDAEELSVNRVVDQEVHVLSL